MILHAVPFFGLGIMLFALGTAVLLISPKIVAFYLSLVEKLNEWYLNIIAQVSGIRYTLPRQSILWKWVRFCCWLVTLLVGILLVAAGAMLLKTSFRFWQIQVKYVMHPSVYSGPPLWQGFIFLALGLSTLVFSPNLVALQLAQAKRTDRWLLDLVGYDGELLLSRREGNQGNGSLLERWREPSHWFQTVFTGLLLAGFGLAILLKVKGLHIGP